MKLCLSNTEILQIVSRETYIHPDLILSSRREDREVSDARFIYYRILRDKGLLLKDIGKFVRNRHHATIINGLKKTEDIPEIKKQYQHILDVVEKIEKQLKIFIQ